MRADLHIHSVHSGDADQTVRDIIVRAKELGLGAIAVTDHNSLRGALEAMDLAEEILILPGVEVTSSEGHLLAYNVIEEIPRDLSPGETIDRIHDLGGIAVAPHPYRIWSGLGEKVVKENRFDAIETMNGRSLPSANRKAGELARSLKVPEVGGSDAHQLDSVGSCYTVFPEECLSPNDLVDMIVGRRTEAGGNGRPFLSSVGYAAKCIGAWMGRGMKRL